MHNTYKQFNKHTLIDKFRGTKRCLQRENTIQVNVKQATS